MTDNEKAIKAYELAKIALVKRVAKSIKEHPEDWSCDGNPVNHGTVSINHKARIKIAHEQRGFFTINGITISSEIEDKYFVPAIYEWATNRAKSFAKAINDSENLEKIETLTIRFEFPSGSYTRGGNVL